MTGRRECKRKSSREKKSLNVSYVSIRVGISDPSLKGSWQRVQRSQNIFFCVVPSRCIEKKTPYPNCEAKLKMH